MYTVCPGCTRQFRLYAEHIAAANGLVRCGFCQEQFNVVGRLHDEPLTNENILNQFDLDVEPQFDIPGQVESDNQNLSEDISDSPDESTVDRELSAAIDEIGVKLIIDDVVEESVEQTSESPVDENNNISIVERYDYAEELLGPDLPKRSKTWSAFWFSACFVGVVALVLQLAWFNRDQVLMKYPQFIPYLNQFCQEFQCKLVRHRNVNQIKLVNRDVRLHPRYQDALLVNATMENELSVRQAYPRVQLTLFDTSGNLLGYRNFKPEDYLDDSIDFKQGMPAGSPVHFVLEVSGPTAGAVSFEFRFL